VGTKAITYRLRWGAGADGVTSLPGALFRGGHYFDRAAAGVFAVSAGANPTFKGFQVGFRCAR